MGKFQRFFRYHTRAFSEASRYLLQKPLGSFTTLLALGISMTLPLILWLFASNVNQLTAIFPKEVSLSVFLKPALTVNQTENFRKELQKRSEIESTRYLSPDQALSELSTQPEFQQLLSSLPENPLPGIIIIIPKEKQNHKAHEQLYHRLQQSTFVELVVMDTSWLLKLHSWLQVLQNLSLLCAAFLGIGMILLISNSIRLAFIDHQLETHVLTLIGASNALIRRPFLYRGLLFGVLGSFFALTMTVGGLLLIQPSLTALFALYEYSFQIEGLSFFHSLLVLSFGGILGWFAAFCAVQPELSRALKRDHL